MNRACSMYSWGCQVCARFGNLKLQSPDFGPAMDYPVPVYAKVIPVHTVYAKVMGYRYEY